MYWLCPVGLCPAELMSFVSIHQVAPATALLLVLLRACFTVVHQVSLSWILYTVRIAKWPWPWLKHSLGQHESLFQVWFWLAQPFGQPSATYGHIAFYYVDVIFHSNVIYKFSTADHSIMFRMPRNNYEILWQADISSSRIISVFTAPASDLSPQHWLSGQTFSPWP